MRISQSVYQPSFMQSDVTDLTHAKSIAKQLFDIFDSDKKGSLSVNDCAPILIQVYKSLNTYYSPTIIDMKNYHNVLDQNKDGVITQDDIEKLCIKYLCSSINEKTHLTSNYSPQDYLKSSKIQGGTTYTSNLVQNNKYVSNTSYDNSNNAKQSEITTFKNPMSSDQYTSSFDTNYRASENRFITKQEVPRSQTMAKTLMTQSSSYVPEIEKKLEKARAIFRQFDSDQSGYLDESEIYNLIKNSINNLGLSNKIVSPDDVQAWMSEVDLNRDGKVSLEEYEYVFLKSLQKQGLRIDSRFYKKKPRDEQNIYSKFATSTYQTSTLKVPQHERNSTGSSDMNKKPMPDRYLKYTREIQKALVKFSKLFAKYDEDGSGSLEEQEIVALLTDTFTLMKINKKPNNEDIQTFLRAAGAKNGKITFEDYEKYILKSFENSGQQIYKDTQK